MNRKSTSMRRIRRELPGKNSESSRAARTKNARSTARQDNNFDLVTYSSYIDVNKNGGSRFLTADKRGAQMKRQELDSSRALKKARNPNQQASKDDAESEDPQQ